MLCPTLNPHDSNSGGIFQYTGSMPLNPPKSFEETTIPGLDENVQAVSLSVHAKSWPSKSYMQFGAFANKVTLNMAAKGTPMGTLRDSTWHEVGREASSCTVTYSCDPTKPGRNTTGVTDLISLAEHAAPKMAATVNTVVNMMRFVREKRLQLKKSALSGKG